MSYKTREEISNYQSQVTWKERGIDYLVTGVLFLSLLLTYSYQTDKHNEKEPQRIQEISPLETQVGE